MALKSSLIQVIYDHEEGSVLICDKKHRTKIRLLRMLGLCVCDCVRVCLCVCVCVCMCVYIYIYIYKAPADCCNSADYCSSQNIFNLFTFGSAMFITSASRNIERIVSNFVHPHSCSYNTGR